MSNMAKDTEQQAIPVDEQFLKDYAAKGGKITDKESGKTVTDVDELVGKVADSGDGTTPTQERLHKRAVAKNAADTAKEDAAKAEKEAARIERLREQERKKKLGKAGRVYSAVSREAQSNVDPLISKAGQAVDAVSNWRTLGGIGLLLAILIFLLFVVVRVNQKGDTRIKQLWYMLNGRAYLLGRQSVQHGSSSGSSGPGGSSPSSPADGLKGIEQQVAQDAAAIAALGPLAPVWFGIQAGEDIYHGLGG